MTLDRSFIEHNRASTDRIRALAASLTDEQMQHPVCLLYTSNCFVVLSDH